MPMRPVLLFILALLLIAHTEFAAASQPIDLDKKSWLPVGINFGSAWGQAPNGIDAADGIFLGAEISYAMTFEPGIWLGAYMDLIHQWNDAQTRFSIGPEFGFAFFGVDGGYVTEFYDGNVYHGIQGRFLLYMAFGGVYLRGGGLWDDDHARDFTEIGLLLKLPIQLSQ